MTEEAADNWHLYVVRCRDGSLYTGIATDVERRLSEHAAGGARAARYLRGRAPLTLVASVHVGNRSRALRLEAQLKKLPRHRKLTLLSDPDRLGPGLDRLLPNPPRGRSGQ